MKCIFSQAHDKTNTLLHPIEKYFLNDLDMKGNTCIIYNVEITNPALVGRL
jgi:hypothetical protein